MGGRRHCTGRRSLWLDARSDVLESEGFLVFQPSPAERVAAIPGTMPAATASVADHSTLPAVAAVADRTVLHVGFGPRSGAILPSIFRRPGWRMRHADFAVSIGNLMTAAVPDLHAEASQSVDAVWTFRTLQRLDAHQVPITLREFFRILKPGGILLLMLPDLQAAAERVAEGRLDEAIEGASGGLDTAMDVIFGPAAIIRRGHREFAHRTGFTAASLAAVVAAAGFEKVTARREDLDLWLTAHRPPPPAAGEVPPCC